jgi:pilus assembly protein CpaF
MCIADGERIITIEDAAELRLQHSHLIALESRPPNLEGRGEVPIRTLVRNALRMRPDRIIVGEVRGAEAFDMLQAMNTGHRGSLTTLHANSPLDALIRLESMVLMAGFELPVSAIRRMIAGAVEGIVQQDRRPDGRRVISAITELARGEAGELHLRPRFIFDARAGTYREAGIGTGSG